MKQSYIYVIFTSTVCKVGKFIRVMTGDEYNHVSVALDERPALLYSFARHYKDAPFYGGFVRESRLRYREGEREAYARVYAVPVSPEAYEAAKTYLEGLSEDSEGYIYNMLSAACAPLHKKVHFDKAFTCIEFAVHILDRYAGLNDLDGQRFYKVGELMELLAPYYLFESPISGFMTGDDWAGDSFPEHKSFYRRLYLTLSTNKNLCARFIRGITSRRAG